MNEGLRKVRNALDVEERQERLLQMRGGMPYAIAFYGIGPVAQEAIFSIVGDQSFSGLLDTVHLLGTNEPRSISRRLWTAAESHSITGNANPVDVIAHEDPQTLEDILGNIDLIFFTANNNAIRDLSRSDIGKITNNVKLIDEFVKYFSDDFTGTINIVSNLPEALAHEALYKLRDVVDPRQVTAHIPLDAGRYRFAIMKLLKMQETLGLDIDVVMGGYHDNPWAALGDVQVPYQAAFENGRVEIKYKSYDFETSQRNASAIRKAAAEYAKEQVKRSLDIQKNHTASEEGKGTNRIGQSIKGPTAPSTGYAIRELAKAFIYREKTICSIPQQFGEEWFYAMRPVTFASGYAELDGKRFSRFAPFDLRQDEDRIVGDGEKSLKNVLRAAGLGDIRISGKPTKSLETRVIEYARPIEIGVDAPPLLDFWTYSVSPLEDKVIRITDASGPQTQNIRVRFGERNGDRKKVERTSIRKLVVGDGIVMAEAHYSHNNERETTWITFSREPDGRLEERHRQSFGDCTLLYMDAVGKGGLEDTAVLFDGSLYFITREQPRSRVIRYTPGKSTFDVISQGMPTDEPLLGVVALQSGLYFAGAGNFYRLHKEKRLRQVSQSSVKPRMLLALPEDDIVMYSDRSSPQVFALSFASQNGETVFTNGPLLDVRQGSYIVMASGLPNGEVLRTEYANGDELLRRKATVCSTAFTPLKRVVVANDAITLALEGGDDTVVQVLERDMKNRVSYTLPKNSHYRFALGES